MAWSLLCGKFFEVAVIHFNFRWLATAPLAAPVPSQAVGVSTHPVSTGGILLVAQATNRLTHGSLGIIGYLVGANNMFTFRSELRANFARTSGQLRTNFAQTSDQLRTNFGPTSHKLRAIFARIELWANFARIELWANFVRSFEQHRTYKVHGNFARTSEGNLVKLLMKFGAISYKVEGNFG